MGTCAMSAYLIEMIGIGRHDKWVLVRQFFKL
jgi:hypothetical protein